MVRIIKKFLTISSIIVLIWSAINLIDVSESELTKELFNNQQQIPRDINGDVYMRGLQIKNVDPLKYGNMLYDLAQDCEKSKSQRCQPYHEKHEMLHFGMVDEDEYVTFNCWFDPTYTFEEGERCASKQELLQIITDHQVLWARYLEMMKFKHFDNDLADQSKFTFKGQDFIYMQQIFNAYLIYLAQEDQTDLAIEMWIQNHQMLNAMMSSRRTIVFSAIVMIAQGMSDKSIIALSSYSHHDADTQNKLEDVLLKPAFGERGMNLKKIYQREHNYIFGQMKNILEENRQDEQNILHLPTPFYAHNHTRNRFAKCVRDIIAFETIPYSEFDKAQEKYKEKPYSKEPYWVELLYNPIGKIALPDFCRSYELFVSRHTSAIKRRMIVLALRARQNNITNAEMAEFIQNAPIELQNPRTGRPFDWDGSYISFLTPDRRIKVLYSY